MMRFLVRREAKVIIVLFFIFLRVFSSEVYAAVKQDILGGGTHFRYVDDFNSVEQAMASCLSFAASIGEVNAYCYPTYDDATNRGMIAAGYLFDKSSSTFYFVMFYFGKCSAPEIFNVSTASCGIDEQKGMPSPESCAGNPINLAVGNKFQAETDYNSGSTGSFAFARAYNSNDGVWRHNYSTSIRFAEGKLSVIHNDGRESFFTVSGEVAVAYPNETGTLVKVNNSWLYSSVDNQQYLFDSQGRLTRWTDKDGLTQQLIYENGSVTVSHVSGKSFTFTEDAQHQPISFTTSDTKIAYHYDNNKHLTQLIRTRGLQTERRQFHYEDARNTGLLTGITDERGIRFATWAYDDKGRAISSQHNGGAALTQVSYNADGSSTVTNELGKTTVYQYQQIGGIKRVTSIQGEPSANCPASNSTYTYNNRGLVLTKTDAKGLITTYEYNDRGLEVSRTEASGTTLARTTTTEWDPDRFLPIRVIEPNRVTVYSYDNQGRVLTRQSTSR
ncbi:DUF6531 domain-containing protein [Pseudomonas syringae]|uniref:DUF6531 domain-containing protein n=1 Tax=Pseudomonas syringae TaxID=317 RepID=UPI0034D62788